jgi:hypothetical protein
MSVYESINEWDGPCIKIINPRQFIVNNIRGYLPLKVVHFCMNLHTLPHTFFFTRHGQSEYNVLGKIGGDAGLSSAGTEYAKQLAIFFKEVIAKGGMIPGDNIDNSNHVVVVNENGGDLPNDNNNGRRDVS